MFIETWKTINEFPNYEISSHGRVYSRKRDIILKPYYDGWKYPKVSLQYNGRRVDRTIHRLVAEAFIPNTLNKPEVNHLDGNKDNNRVDNLEWVTRSENEIHAFKNGLNDRSSYDAGRPKRRVLVIETGDVFNSICECAEYFNCTHTNVISCLRGKINTCRGYHLKYV